MYYHIHRRNSLKEPSVRRLLDLLSLEEQLRQEEIPLKSDNIGSYLGTTGDSIRKDLSNLVSAGEKVHYGKRNLQEQISEGLKLQNSYKTCLVGLGNMGMQVLQWIPGWKRVDLAVLFDTKMNRLERMNQQIPAYPAWEIPEYIPGSGIKTAILATEPEEAEKNAQRLIDGGISSILNLTGYYLAPPSGGIRINNINLLTELLVLNRGL